LDVIGYMSAVAGFIDLLSSRFTKTANTSSDDNHIFW